MSGSLEIRAATPADIPAILALLRQLAAYERMLDRVRIDEKRLAEHVFGPKPYAEILLGCVDGAPVAYALFFPHFASFAGLPWLYLEDICVQQKQRGQGIGEAMMAALARIAADRGWAGMVWQVLDWNEPAFAFYHRLGATRGNGHVSMQLSGDALLSLSRLTRT